MTERDNALDLELAFQAAPYFRVDETTARETAEAIRGTIHERERGTIN